MDAKEKVVLITGGAQGQGRSHALKFAENGFDVVIGDVKDPNDEASPTAETVKRIKAIGRKALGVKCDVTKGEEVEALFNAAVAEFGHINVAIANAGIMTFGMTWELEEKQVQALININLLGVWRTNKEAAKQMMKQGYGRIINIASTAGLKASPNLAHYAMSKFGVIGLTKTLAKEVASKGITVNAICPTMVQSPMTRRPEFLQHVERLSGKKFASFEEADAFMATKHPLGAGFLKAEEVSRLCLWLGVSDEAAHITGATIPLDAGSLL